MCPISFRLKKKTRHQVEKPNIPILSRVYGHPKLEREITWYYCEEETIKIISPLELL